MARVGWRVSATTPTDFALDALYTRRPKYDGSRVHHGDRGSQYVSIRYSDGLAQAGIKPLVGSRGDSYDNALAQTIRQDGSRYVGTAYLVFTQQAALSEEYCERGKARAVSKKKWCRERESNSHSLTRTGF